MISIIKNTFKIFFIQYIAFGIMCLFVLGLGGYFWVLPGDQNLLDAGFGDLTQVFRIMPWAVMPLVSTLSMRLFSVPSDNGTLDLLLTKPISVQSIVSGHFIGAFLVFLVLILSTISYPFSLAALITGPNDFDWGLYWSGLFGIILLGSLWLALGLLSSSLTKNPLVALILSLILNISSYFVPGVYGPNIIFMEFVSGLWPVGGGLYLISLTLVFLFLTRLSLEKIIYKKVHKFNKIKWFNVLNDFKIPAVIILLGILSLNYAPKWDVTTDQRFTLSKTTQDVLSGLNQTVFVDVLLDGELPLPFERLSQETEALLGRYGDYIELNINRLDPSESSIIQPSILQNLADFGVKANQITIKRNSRQESVLVYPYAMLTYNEKTVAVPLIKPTLREDLEESIATSIRYLEYAFTDALIQLSRPRLKKVAIMRGHEQASDIAITEFIEAIKPYYYVGPFTMDSVTVNPQSTLEVLKQYDLMVMANPKRPFNNKEKLVLDQFVMSGGRSLWLLDGTRVAGLDQNGQSLATGQSLNLTDLFFTYGFRINQNLVLDMVSAPITLASLEKTGDYSRFPWWFSPLVQDHGLHPIMANVDGIKMDYVSSIDTLSFGPKKTVLLHSSPRSKTIGVPYLIDLNKEIESQIQMTQSTNQSDNSNNTAFNEVAVPMAVLLEGRFNSAFKNRILPFDLDQPLKESRDNKMVIVADGSVIQNDVQSGQALPLGYDPWTRLQFGNREFLLNTVNYLMGDQGLINIRSKEINLPFLDPNITRKWRGSFLVLNLVLPLVIVSLLSVLIQYRRKRRYAR